jgi:hypothetical protein
MSSPYLESHAVVLGYITNRRNNMTDTATPIRRFTITSMEGEKPTGDSHRVSSEYVEHEWLPYLGPTALLFARRIDYLMSTDGKNAVDVKHWADQLGVCQAEVLLAANRLIRFGLAQWSERDKTLLLSRHWPSVPMAIATPQHRSVLLDLPDVEVSA